MLGAFLTSYLRDYLAYLVLETFPAYCLDVLGHQAFVCLDDWWACCSAENLAHHVGQRSCFVTFPMAFLVRLEASLEHQEEGQTYSVLKGDLQLAFLEAILDHFEAYQDHLEAYLDHLEACWVQRRASFHFLVAWMDH